MERESSLDPDTCYRAIVSHDRRFDGRFFVGVSSTGIYCRPICAVRTPKRENCTFFPTAAAAEKQGYRPCLRCRPELAPGHALSELSGRLAQAAARLIEEGFLADADLPALAARIGVTDRHLRRLFQAQYGVTPLEYAQTQRLLLAKRLLTDTALPITEVAMAAGFGSVRRFNELLRSRYGIAPGTIRRGNAAKVSADELVFELGYRPPMAWPALMAFLGARVVEGVEQFVPDMHGGSYGRTVAVEVAGRVHRGWFRLTLVPSRCLLRVAVSPTLAHAVPQVLGKVRRLCDLGCRPDVVDGHLGELAAATPGMRLPGAVDGFEIAVRAVLGQVVSVAQARAMLGRLVAAHGMPIPAPDGKLRLCFPAAADLAALAPAQLEACGIPPGKARTVNRIAHAVASGALSLEAEAPPEQTVAALCDIDGVGDWTAQYVAMRALGWPDAFPASDYALRKVMGMATAGQVRRHAAQWAPWRAYAAMHLWQRYAEQTAQTRSTGATAQAAAIIPAPEVAPLQES
ncbi:DNA-3-methyladenine glycosylase 2 family protein [Cupriavidus sp. AU9028]|uniref:DNA-3-methyladenine glycosylase 2 family protein n=1 Tax=Cupriavidus sp. AU9028 TaxID=2871157 RepID=UPI0021051062|nr:DNA-3-methyladenine glycosylase 2 family protein [Cupriavidus sp. AU9028]